MSEREKIVDRSVFAALSPVIKRNGIELVGKKTRARFIQEHIRRLQPTINRWSLDHCVQSVARLARSRVFASPEIANQYFGTSATTSATTPETRGSSSVESLEHGSDSIDVLTDQPPFFDAEEEHEPLEADTDPTTDNTLVTDFDELEDSAPKNIFTQPGQPTWPFFNVSLPQRIQHPLLDSVQKALEQACFTFASQHFPEEISHRGWDSPEAVELTQWRSTIPKYLHRASPNDSTGTLATLREVFHGVTKLRNAAVHREHLTLPQLEAMLDRAVTLGKLLQDTHCVDRVQQSKDLIHQFSQDMQENQTALLHDYRAQVAHKKKELAALERHLEQQIVAKDELHCATACAQLDGGIWLLQERKPPKAQGHVTAVPDGDYILHGGNVVSFREHVGQVFICGTALFVLSGFLCFGGV